MMACWSASSGAYGERDGAGRGRDRERRALPERRQRPASQIHQRVGPGAADHHVASGRDRRESQRAFWTESNGARGTKPEEQAALRRLLYYNEFGLVLATYNRIFHRWEITAHVKSRRQG